MEGLALYNADILHAANDFSYKGAQICVRKDGERCVKRGWMLFLILLFCAALIPGRPARADVGPKPSVTVTFAGLEGETYFATLLSANKTTGPYSVWQEGTASVHCSPEDPAYDAFLRMAAYEDTDGFYFVQYIEDCTESQRLRWTYYPPLEFKILLYFPAYDSFVVSEESYTRYAFDSYYRVDASSWRETAAQGGTGITAHRNYDYGGEILALLVRIVLTIALELGVALLFGFREGRALRWIGGVNLATQGLLNLLLNLVSYSLGPLLYVASYILLEAVVFGIEAALYARRLPRACGRPVSKGRAVLYALTANTLSFAAGFLLARWLPVIF